MLLKVPPIVPDSIPSGVNDTLCTDYNMHCMEPTLQQKLCNFLLSTVSVTLLGSALNIGFMLDVLKNFVENGNQ